LNYTKINKSDIEVEKDIFVEFSLNYKKTKDYCEHTEMLDIIIKSNKKRPPASALFALT